MTLEIRSNCPVQQRFSKSFAPVVMGLWALLIAAMMSGCADSNRPTPPVAKNGVIDLRSWDFEKHGAVPLSGDWHFWWEEFVPPAAFVSGVTPPEPQGLYPVPKLWNGMEHPTKEGEVLSGEGYATFAIRVLLPPDPQRELGIYYRSNYLTQRNYLVDGGLVHGILEAGQPGPDSSSFKPGFYSFLSVSSLIAVPSTFWLITQGANYGHPRGGLARPPVIGIESWLEAEISTERIRDAILIGILLIMGLYHLGVNN